MKTGSDKDRREQRADIRHSCSKMTEFFVEGRGHLGCVKNESKSGLFIETRGNFRLGQEITIIFTEAGLEFKKTGRIVSIHSEGVGIRFNWPGYTR